MQKTHTHTTIYAYVYIHKHTIHTGVVQHCMIIIAQNLTYDVIQQSDMLNWQTALSTDDYN